MTDKLKNLILSRLAPLMAAAWFVAVAWVACASPPVEPDPPERVACWTAALARFSASVAACPGPWEDCPDRDAIVETLRVQQEACP